MRTRKLAKINNDRRFEAQFICFCHVTAQKHFLKTANWHLVVHFVIEKFFDVTSIGCMKDEKKKTFSFSRLCQLTFEFSVDL